MHQGQNPDPDLSRSVWRGSPWSCGRDTNLAIKKNGQGTIWKNILEGAFRYGYHLLAAICHIFSPICQSVFSGEPLKTTGNQLYWAYWLRHICSLHYQGLYMESLIHQIPKKRLVMDRFCGWDQILWPEEIHGSLSACTLYSWLTFKTFHKMTHGISHYFWP